MATGAVGVSIWRDRSESIDDEVRDASNIAVLLGGQIARSIQSLDIVLRGLQRRLDELDILTPFGSLRIPNPVYFRNSLLQQRAILPQASQIVITDERGQVIMSTAALPAPDISVAEREYFKTLAANDDDRLSISLPFASPFTGEQTIVLARRINGPDRAFLGIVFVSVRTSYFEGVYGAVHTLHDQTFALMRRDGTVLLRHPDTQDRAGQKMPATWPFHTAVRNGGGSYRSPGVFDRMVRWVAVRPLDEYPLVVTIAVPEDVILKAWWTRSTSAIVGTLVFLTCALGLLAIMGRQYRNLSASEASLAEKSQALESEHAQLLASEAQLRRQNQLFDTALNNMNQGLAMFDADARLVVCNEHYRKLHQLSPAQAAPGRSLRDIIRHHHELCGYPHDVDEHLAKVFAIVSSRTPRVHELKDSHGSIIAIRNNPMPSGGWVATFENITDRRANEAKIEWLANNDILTGIANRSYFLQQIDKAGKRLQATGEPFSVLMLDLDHFKHVNDSLGHAAGDTLLRETARRLKASLRATDVLARLGGDEFAIIQTPPRLFESIDDSSPIMRESAIVLSNRIVDLIGEPYDIDGQKVVIGASVGIAMAPKDGMEPDDLMKKADLALYKIKAEGRNGYSFFDEDMGAAAGERRRLEVDLRESLSRNEFELYYQPQVDVATRRPCGMEALIRWHHPDRGLMMPDRFISLAEDTDLIVPLGEWILQMACADAANWPPHVKVAINISPIQFRRTNLFDVIMCALVDSGLPPDRLEIEITERVLLEEHTDYIPTLHQLKNLGVSIVLDDFGTGHSSLSYLQTFPFDKIKIDRSFTKEVLERADCAAIACAIVNLGRSLDIVTIAEGIETWAQFEALRAAGLTQAQGFLFGRPMPAAKIKFDGFNGVFADETVWRHA